MEDEIMKTMKFSCEQIHFLGVRTQIDWDMTATEPMKLWEQMYADQTMERLMQVCQANKVYALMCYDCNMEEKKLTYDIVCENRAGAVSNEFMDITIEPAKYFAFEKKGNDPLEREKVHEELYEEAYREWLPESGCEALVDPYIHKAEKGYAVIETVTPKEPESTNYTMELWLPVSKQ